MITKIILKNIYSSENGYVIFFNNQFLILTGWKNWLLKLRKKYPNSKYKFWGNYIIVSKEDECKMPVLNLTRTSKIINIYIDFLKKKYNNKIKNYLEENNISFSFLQNPVLFDNYWYEIVNVRIESRGSLKIIKADYSNFINALIILNEYNDLYSIEEIDVVFRIEGDLRPDVDGAIDLWDLFEFYIKKNKGDVYIEILEKNNLLNYIIVPEINNAIEYKLLKIGKLE